MDFDELLGLITQNSRAKSDFLCTPAGIPMAYRAGAVRIRVHIFEERQREKTRERNDK
jgi:hypothetical protein